jgi:HlyD family secretion protein
VGDSVEAGSSVVARVEPATPALLDARTRAEAEAALAEAMAALDLARADLTRAEEEERFARLQTDRTRALVERGVAAVTQMESISQQLAVAEATVTAARARSAMAQGVLERAEAALMRPLAGATPASCCVDLTAPADGVVLSIATISEHPVQPGAPLVSIGDPADLEIVADLLSADAVRIGPGTRAIVERWGGPAALEAVLTRIEPAAQTRVSALGIEEQRVDAIFRIVTPPDQRPGLGHGFAVFLHIVEWETPQALQVPLGALFRRDEAWAVFVVENGRAREQPVTLGQRNARMAEVLTGVREGAQIITHPSDAVTDGAAVADRRNL